MIPATGSPTRSHQADSISIPTLAPSRKVHPFLWDVGLTTFTAGLVLASGLIVVSLVGKRMGALAVGEYLLLRRVSTWLGSGTQLGLGVALPRYVALSVDHPQSDQFGYLVGAFLALLGVNAALGLVLLSARSMFAQWLFGQAQAGPLITPLAFLLIGQSTHTALYGFYRGRLSMNWANALQIANTVVLPLFSVALWYRIHSVAFIVGFNGAAMLGVSTLFLLPFRGRLVHAEGWHLRSRIRELLKYGCARVPGEFAGNALFALGPVIASHYLPLSEVAHLLLGLGLLMAISLSITPCGTVLLSKISMMIARNQMEQVRARLEQFVAGVLELSVFGCLQVVIFADVLVRVWVGQEYLTGLDVIHITLLSIPFLLFFVAIRSAIDAATVVAHNAHNGYAALAVFLVLTGLAVAFAPRSFLLDGISIALLIANAVLAWLTSRVAKNLFNLGVPWRHCALPLVLAFLLGGVSFAIHHYIWPPMGLIGIILMEIAMAAIFVGLSAKLGSTWLAYFWNFFSVERVSRSAA